MTSKKPPVVPAEPPEHLTEEEAQVWRDVVAGGRIAPSADGPQLEAYCALVVRWRDASKRIVDEGLVVDGGERRGAIVHPALVAERQLAEQLRAWGPLFNRAEHARRRPGPMYDATRRSIAAAGLKDKPEFEGACEAVAALAWQLDEAQRESIDAFRRAAEKLIPIYMKGCADLQITPAAIPAARPQSGAPAQSPAEGPAPVSDIGEMRAKLGRG